MSIYLGYLSLSGFNIVKGKPKRMEKCKMHLKLVEYLSIDDESEVSISPRFLSLKTQLTHPVLFTRPAPF